MSVDDRPVAAEAAPGQPGGRQGLVLAVLATAQVMIILDSTIMNIALPSIQRDLGVSSGALAWIVTAYVLSFGGLLLIGGRAGDIYGRLRVFRLGIVVFTLASLVGGLAPNEGVLIAARAAQGLGGALVSPAVVALIAANFPEGPARNRAMGVYGSMNGVGSTLGLLLGGVLTAYLDWRWVLLVNVPVGAAVVWGTRLLRDPGRHTGRLDVPGAVTGTIGLTSLVYGLTRGGEEGWSDAVAVASLGSAAVLLAVFLAVQARSGHPMMPLRLLRDRNRSGGYATMLLIGAGMFAMYYFLTLYMQQILGYSAMRTGLAYLPLSLGMFVSGGFLAPRLVGLLPTRAVTGPGLALSALGVLWLGTLTPDSAYLTHLAPAMLMTSVGLGLCFMPLTVRIVSGVPPQETGIAAGVLTTASQVGGAVGLAFLPGIATATAEDRLAGAPDALLRALATDDQGLLSRAADALTHGYGTAFRVVAVLYAVALVTVVAVVTAKGPRAARPEEQPAQQRAQA
ncbi:MFS transporter [Streptomyces sp. enrichment culture]|uniref:MFS transporter n=1 Tax=Streptomyces sp. enrichment culture TaxID=1795815 RepID=UPI003F5554C1